MAFYKVKENNTILFPGNTMTGGSVIETDKDLLEFYGAHMVEVISAPPKGVKPVKFPTAEDYAAANSHYVNRRQEALAKMSKQLEAKAQASVAETPAEETAAKPEDEPTPETEQPPAEETPVEQPPAVEPPPVERSKRGR